MANKERRERDEPVETGATISREEAGNKLPTKEQALRCAGILEKAADAAMDGKDSDACLRCAALLRIFGMGG